MPRKLKNSLASITAEEMNLLTETMTDKQIAEYFGDCSKNNVGHRRRSLGVKSYGEKHGVTVGVKGASNVTNRKHHFNESFFQSIDSEIKAYALGLFFTDGHITKELNRARLSFTEKDSIVLTQIAQEVGLDAPLLVDKPRKGNYQVHNMIVLNLNSTCLVNDLLSLGLSPSKDDNTVLPCIPAHLECHLLRGIIDGDGYIPSLTSYARQRSMAEISGREGLLQSINLLLERNGFCSGSIEKMKGIHRLRFKKAHLPVLDWAYGCNPVIAIPRKLKRYLELKEFIKAYPMI